MGRKGMDDHRFEPSYGHGGGGEHDRPRAIHAYTFLPLACLLANTHTHIYHTIHTLDLSTFAIFLFAILGLAAIPFAGVFSAELGHIPAIDRLSSPPSL